MTQSNVSKNYEIFQAALEKDSDFLKELLKATVQEILEEERNAQIGVGDHVRDDAKRQGNRNGYKPRRLKTRVGELELLKPQIREFPFKTALFGNYQRSEKALLACIQQMVIDGVSTNKVKNILRKLSPELSCSKSNVSRIVGELDPMIEKWRNEKLSEYYSYMISDATYLYVRNEGAVVSMPLFVSVGVTKEGKRKILGLDLYERETEATWKEHINQLKSRGLDSVDLTISDGQKGLIKVLNEEFSNTPHQRCIVHFERNLLDKLPYKERKRAANYIKYIYSSPTKELALKIVSILYDEYINKYPEFATLLDEHIEETLTYYNYPQKHWKKIRTTNLLEGVVNTAIKRRLKVAKIFPNKASCIRYAACILMELDEDWQTGRNYMKPEGKNEEKCKDAIFEKMEMLRNEV